MANKATIRQRYRGDTTDLFLLQLKMPFSYRNAIHRVMYMADYNKDPVDITWFTHEGKESDTKPLRYGYNRDF